MGDLEGLSRIPPGERVLLLSHCLRPSGSCPGKFSRDGLECPEACPEACLLKEFRETASRLGYKGVCIAAGGAMAVNFVKKHRPRGIVAVACSRELEEGVERVMRMGLPEPPVIVVVPLLRDGCIDTEVDAPSVLRAIAA